MISPDFLIVPWVVHHDKGGAGMLKSLMIAGGFCVGLVVTGPAVAAHAGTIVDIGVGPYAANDQGSYYWPVRNGLSCVEGRRVVASAGFRDVSPFECRGSEYTYRGIRRDGVYRITLRPGSGRIEDIERIRSFDPYGWDGDLEGENDYSDRGYGYGADGFASGDYGAGFDDDVDF
jgi:hypothetical protein